MEHIRRKKKTKLTKTPANEIALPIKVKYAIACLAAMGAHCVTHPMDLVKVRMQVGCSATERGSLNCVRTVIYNEGFFGLYKGITAGLLRQATYVTTRIGSFTTMTGMYRHRKKAEPSVYTRLTMAVVSGSIGGMVGTPADVVLVRMEADGHAPKEKRRKYKNVANGIMRIWREEGFLRLYAGIVPTMIRAAISNSVVLVSYPYFKHEIRAYWDLDNGFILQFSASMISAFIVSVLSMPHDMAKTRIQNMRYPNGIPEYSGTIDVWRRVIHEKGTFGLYRGFDTYYTRMGPYTVLTLMFLERLNAMYFKHVMGIQGEARWI